MDINHGTQRQNIAGHCQHTFEKKFDDIPQQCFALLPQVNFHANNLNFHWRWRWWDRIQAIFLNLFYFNFSINFLTYWQNYLDTRISKCSRSGRVVRNYIWEAKIRQNFLILTSKCHWFLKELIFQASEASTWSFLKVL